MSYLQAIVIGIIQGIAEMFPVSSLGHTVLVPALIRGSWRRLVTQEASPESPYLAYVVGLHVATALAIFWALRREWWAILRGFGRTLTQRRIADDEGRLAWLIVLATIPVGLLGLLLEHQLRTLFAKLLAAACFLTVNGVILLVADTLRRRDRRRRRAARAAALGPEACTAASGGVVPLRQAADASPGAVTLHSPSHPAPSIASRIRWADAVGIGIAQTAALLAGISRDGICMVAGLWRGLGYEDAARFAFLLSAPPILAAGALKLPDLLGPLGESIRGQVVAGSVAAFLTATVAVRLLLRWFRSRSLRPFGIYCLLFGIACVAVFA